MRPAPAVLAGLLAIAVLGGGAAWWWYDRGASPADEILPTPPEPPRLVDAPEYDRCLAMLDDDPQGARMFAETWAQTGGGEGAEHCAALATLSLGEAERAAEQLERIASRSQAGLAARAAVFGQAAEAWLAANDPRRAHAAVTLALALAPNDPDLLVQRANASLAINRPGDALADLDRATQLDPNRAEAWVLRAGALRRQDRVDAASQDIARALMLQPDNPEALLERGIIRQLRGDAAGARADWERAIVLAPDSPAADLAAQNLALNEAGPQRR